MDDVQNTTQLEFDEGALLRKQMGLITPIELANALGVSEITLQVWRQKGTGPRFTKLGKNVFYPMREVKEWVEMNVLDRVSERTINEVPKAKYKTGEVVKLDTVTPTDVSFVAYGDASDADKIDQALTKLIGHEDD